MLVPILESQSEAMNFSDIPMMGMVSDYFSDMDPNTKLQSVSAVLAVILLLRGILLYFVGVLGGMIPLNLQQILFARGYDALLHVEYSYFTEKTTGDHANSLYDWVMRVTSVLTNVAVATYAIILFLVYLVLMLSLSWEMAIMGAILAIFMSAALKKFSIKVLRRTGEELSDKTGKVSELIFETIGGMKFIRAAAMEEKMFSRYQIAVDERTSANKIMVLYQSITSPFLTTFSGLLICFLLFIAPYINDGKEQWIGGLFLFLFLTMRLLAPVSQISQASMQIASHMFALERLEKFFVETEQRKQPSGNKPYSDVKSEIAFENVFFQYDESVKRAINGLSLKIPVGKMVAIVGPSGSGKSTLVSLLTRFYDLQNGRITFDGQDLAAIDVYELRRNVSVVSQDTFIFNDTVRNNLLFAADGVSDDDIVHAAKLAAADEFIRTLPEGYDTKLGDRGVRLSGGQKQRIAIARAILGSSDLLIFDEATSHLDTYTEQAIQNAVEVLRQDRTVLVIAHRLSTIRRADIVAVVEDGAVIEQGSHVELMAAQGRYWDMVNHQNLDLVDVEDEGAEA